MDLFCLKGYKQNTRMGRRGGEGAHRDQGNIQLHKERLRIYNVHKQYENGRL